MAERCSGCGGSLINDENVIYGEAQTCKDTGLIGYWCFTCGDNGHLPVSSLYKDKLSFTGSCPNCGEDNIYLGGCDQEGIIFGATKG